MQVQELQLGLLDVDDDVVGVLVLGPLGDIFHPILIDIAIDDHVSVGQHQVTLQYVDHLVGRSRNQLVSVDFADALAGEVEVLCFFLTAGLVHRLELTQGGHFLCIEFPVFVHLLFYLLMRQFNVADRRNDVHVAELILVFWHLLGDHDLFQLMIVVRVNAVLVNILG